MQMQLIFEMVFAVGAGLGLARWHFENQEMVRRVQIFNRWDYNLEFAENVFVGIALVGMMGTILERFRISEPKPWRFGRMAWVTAGGFVLVTQLMPLTFRLIAGKQRGVLPLSQYLVAQMVNIQTNSGSQFLRVWPLMFPALAITCLVGRVGADGKSDARDWFGRVFSVLVVVTGMLNYIYIFVMI